jgi:hypothetical protein
LTAGPDASGHQRDYEDGSQPAHDHAMLVIVFSVVTLFGEAQDRRCPFTPGEVSTSRWQLSDETYTDFRFARKGASVVARGSGKSSLTFACGSEGGFRTR